MGFLKTMSGADEPKKKRTKPAVKEKDDSSDEVSNYVYPSDSLIGILLTNCFYIALNF